MLVMLMVMVSCKTKKVASTYSPENSEYSKTEQVSQRSDVISNEEKPITYRTENVEVAQTEDQAFANYNYYVITGSFSSLENAATLKKEMKRLGYTPVILISDSGMYRVTAGQTNSESDARSVINKIRNTYSEYNDVWLLKRK
jgi:cell division protein FtsN